MSAMTDRFRQLHQSGCFVIPNPFDAGTARVLERLGFPALATTSAGFAWTLGKADNRVTLDEELAHLRAISGAVGVPVNADFEGGFAVAPEDVARNVSAAAATGIAGLSIEDSVKDAAEGLLDFDLAVARIVAARRAIDQSGSGVLLTARSEGFIAGRPDLDETIRRLVAFSEAGADVLYAPGIRDLPTIRTLVAALPKPVNVVMGLADPSLTLRDLEDAGVRRVSVGGALARLALAAVRDAALAMREQGSFRWVNDILPAKDLRSILAR